jgi:hypothetical protein
MKQMQWRKRAFGLKPLLLAAACGAVVVAVSAIVHSTSATAAAQAHSSPAATLQHELAQVRGATARFHNLDNAIAAGYELGWVNGSNVRILTGCVSSPTAGAMGYHYINPALVADNAVDLTKPEALVYESAPDGGRKLVAVEWIVRSAQSNPPGVSAPPSVLGMPMHILVPPPGPAFYLMHAWIWKHNPAGIMADWNPRVTCP